MPHPAISRAYSERLYVPASWWALGLLFVLAVGWAFFVATPLPAAMVAVGVAALLVGGGLGAYGAVQLEVDDDALRAGRAYLVRSAVGGVVVLDPESTRRLLGREADARAFLVTRPYCSTAVKVEVDDPTDPTPYWLVSTRDPQRLAASLHARGVRD